MATISTLSSTRAFLELETVNCNLCDSKNHKIIGTKKGVLTGKPFNLVQCRDCGLIFINPRPTAQAIASLYDKEYYDGKGFDANVNYFDASFLHINPEGFLANIASVCRHTSGPLKLLDVGCGLGNFLYYADKAGYDCYGSELSAFAVDYVRKRLPNITVFSGDHSGCKLKFDVITAIEVVEHLHDPLSFFKSIKALLADDGIFAFTTSNAQKMTAFTNLTERGIKWNYVLPEGHIYYYTPITINAYFKKVGLKPVDLYSNNLWQRRKGVVRLYQKIHSQHTGLNDFLFRSIIKGRDAIMGEKDLPWAINR